MKKVTVIAVFIHGVLLVYGELALAFKQIDEGNYIVPRMTLELSTSSNKSAEGHKKICTSNLDCEMYANNQCCQTISGYSKCRKKCRPKKKPPKIRAGNERKAKKHHKHKKKFKNIFTTMSLGCVFESKKVYKEGEVVKSKDGCNSCTCRKGNMECTEKYCPPGKCAYRNKYYDDGHHLLLHNGCKRCICQYSSWNCTIQSCEEKDLKQYNSSRSMLANESNSAVPILSYVLSALLYSIVHL